MNNPKANEVQVSVPCYSTVNWFYTGFCCNGDLVDSLSIGPHFTPATTVSHTIAVCVTGQRGMFRYASQYVPTLTSGFAAHKTP